MGKYIISTEGGRLGTRLISYLNAKRISKFAGFEPKLHWPAYKNFEINDFHLFFSAMFIENNILSYEDVKSSRRLPYEKLISTKHEDLHSLFSTHGSFVLDSPRPLMLSGETMFDVARDAPDLLDDRDLTHEAVAIRDEARRLAAADKPWIGIHIRRGDLFDEDNIGHDWFHKYSPISYYREFISSFISNNEDMRFIIVSDEKDAISQLMDISSQICTTDILFGQIDSNNIQAAWRDMSVLSCCKRVIAPDFSGFSTAGALLGGRIRERIEDCLSVPQKISALESNYRKIIALNQEKITYREALDIALYARLLSETENPGQAIPLIRMVTSSFAANNLFNKMGCDIAFALNDKSLFNECLHNFLSAFDIETDSGRDWTALFGLILTVSEQLLKAGESRNPALESECQRLDILAAKARARKTHPGTSAVYAFARGNVLQAEIDATYAAQHGPPMNARTMFRLGDLAIRFERYALATIIMAKMERRFGEHKLTAILRSRLTLLDKK